MKILYLDCGMGAAGDMLTAALLELLPDPQGFLEELNALGIPGVRVEAESVSKCGIRGTHISVKVHGEEEGEFHNQGDHHHSSMQHVEEIIADLPLSSKVKEDVLAVYGLIAQAESHVHGVPVSQIHFHEVGSMDAVADVTAVCMLMERLAPDQVIVSPVHVGSGQVRCAHGILPVPAPATAYLLKDIPVYGGAVKGELCTPTGAALLKYFGDSFGEMPVMRASFLGYGMGKKDFERANCVRALLGETEKPEDRVTELSCNIDDMTGEAVGFAIEELFRAGALEVYTVPVGMKKSRPGILLCVMCREEDRDKMLGLIFRHTTTIGVRESISRRYTLSRCLETVHTKYGDIRRKVSSGYGITRKKYEYEDLAGIARERGISIQEIREQID